MLVVGLPVWLALTPRQRVTLLAMAYAGEALARTISSDMPDTTYEVAGWLGRAIGGVLAHCTRAIRGFGLIS